MPGNGLPVATMGIACLYVSIAAMDRINHHAHHVEITGSSYRAHGKRKQELIKMGGQRKAQ
ncbi:hypothetical protein [Candidatus Magnetaquicoccus inordinatus]|uniref:hypothetical protein n=1 Tax=Candidatus Magnetaquicoccus inordinatus TaxID=2496818 RepID=UPI00102AC101|nr:hypothetical protein [Candidatus Magnetaquicoccus inordinatus]